MATAACWCSVRLVRSRELGVRVADDATFGPVIAFGPGGTAGDGTRDLAMDLPPLNLPLAHGLIGRCRIGAILGRPLRDQPAADEPAVAEALVRISQLIVDWPEIAALEVPALFADTAGVTAADAWLLLRPPGAPPAVLAIAPYPVELARSWSDGDGELPRPPDPPGGCRATRRLLPPAAAARRALPVLLLDEANCRKSRWHG